MEKVINIGIIGAGVVGERVIKALQKHTRARISGIYDVDLDRLKLISNQYNIPTVKDYKDLIENNHIDMIYLAVPPKYHHPIAMEIIRAKKHFICEKPLANTTDEAREMFEAAEEQGMIHAMNFPAIYGQGFIKLQTMLEEGFIGKLRRVELHTYFKQWPRPWQQNNWIATREQGGFVREVFTHYVQMIQMMLGKLADFQVSIQYPEDSAACETGIIATAALDDGTPVLLNGFSDIGMEENLSLTFYGTEGTLSLVNWRELWVATKETAKTKVDIPDNDPLVDLLHEVFKAVDGEPARIVNFKEGYEVQRAIEILLGRERERDE